ncbi:MAG: tetratricopeptide repeat protein, partial [Pseudomonadota bacterium]|nr:tetratricopeptide repeat protein [Pseudomonadota bacterium]
MNIKNQLKIISSLYSKGNFIEIIDYVEQNSDHIENDWKILTIIGLAFFNNNDLEKAIYYQNKSIDKEPTSHNFHNLGLILRKKGDFQGAINAFNKCLKIGIDQPVYYSNIIDFCLENNSIHDALKVSNHMRNKFPDNPRTFFNLGLTYEKLNKYSDSLIFYEKCLKIDSTDILAMNNLGNVYSSLRKTDLAEK